MLANHYVADHYIGQRTKTPVIAVPGWCHRTCGRYEWTLFGDLYALIRFVVDVPVCLLFNVYLFLMFQSIYL